MRRGCPNGSRAYSIQKEKYKRISADGLTALDIDDKWTLS
jgi:hypothetical protein